MSAVGWHGKLPSTGDFVSRRLDAEQLAALDGWLAQSLLSLRERAPAAWLDAYLASPSWRFLWMPRAAPAPFFGSAWIGVMIPSVDAVGRYFPLALVHGLDALPPDADAARAVWDWLQRLEQVAADALDGDWSIEALELALEQLGVPAPAAHLPEPLPPVAAGSGLIALRADADPAAQFALDARALWSHERADRCYWYCATEHYAPTLIASAGLNDPDLPAALFGNPDTLR
jgi:type VI secretion system protein ImpM